MRLASLGLRPLLFMLLASVGISGISLGDLWMQGVGVLYTTHPNFFFCLGVRSNKGLSPHQHWWLLGKGGVEKAAEFCFIYIFGFSSYKEVNPFTQAFKSSKSKQRSGICQGVARGRQQERLQLASAASSDDAPFPQMGALTHTLSSRGRDGAEVTHRGWVRQGLMGLKDKEEELSGRKVSSRDQ